MKFAIITGVSRGLGESLAKILLEREINVYGISRSNNENLKKIARKNHVHFEHFACDLGDVVAIEQTLYQLNEQLIVNNPTKIYLINNAAVLEPVNHAMNIEASDLIDHVKTNMLAPMIIMNFFLKNATKRKIPLIGLNITSGAAERPVYGWNAYCSTKASINMYTKTVALEQEHLKTGHKIIAFSPGIMDTKMQDEIRSSSYDAFIEVETFKDYHRNNDLRDTDIVAKVIAKILADQVNIENGKIYDVNDYLSPNV